MVRVSLRNLLANKLRLLLTVAAVTVGVSFVSGTFVLSDTMAKAFDELYVRLTAGTDVVVRAESAYTDLTTQGQPRPVDDSLVDRVSRLPEVDLAEGGVAGFALVLDKDGDPIQPGGAPTIGASVSGDPRLAGEFTFRSGRMPSGPDEMALDARTAEGAGYRLGDSVEVVVQSGKESFTLVGIVGFGETDSLLGATLAGWDLPTTQRLVDKVGQVDEVRVKAVPGTSPEELREIVGAVLPGGVEAVTGEQVAADGSAAVREGMGVFTKVLLVFAGVSLVVGSFVIWNTFSVLVAQRRREVALLRAVGATRRQVLAGILAEAGLIGLMAGVIGIGAGLGLAVGIRSLLKLTGIEIPTTSPALEGRTIVAGLAVGLLVTTVAAVAPAWTATRVSPMEALRQAAPGKAEVRTVRRVLSWALIVTGAAGLAVAAVIGNLAIWTGVATATTFAGLVAAGPTLAGGMARIADHGRRGNSWRLAARNIARSRRRAAATALALTIGLTVVSAVAVTASSLNESVAEAVSSGNRSDLFLQGASTALGISPAAADLLRQRSDVDTVVELRRSGARIGGEVSVIAGADTAGLDRVLDLGIETGSLAELRSGHILIGARQARDLDLTAGDDVRVTFPETGDVTLTVAGTFSQQNIIGAGYVISLDDFAANVTSKLDAAILVTVAPGVDRSEAETAIESALADYPNITVSNPEDLTRKVQGSVNQLLGLVTALLLLAVVVAVLGIVNTLVLAVVERTRELGLMRAVGATRRQVRSVVRRESVLMSLLGAVTGIALGTASGVALSRALADEGITAISVPVTTLASYVLVAAVVGVLAAVGPARRASRVNMLQAITTE